MDLPRILPQVMSSPGLYSLFAMIFAHCFKEKMDENKFDRINKSGQICYGSCLLQFVLLRDNVM